MKGNVDKNCFKKYNINLYNFIKTVIFTSTNLSNFTNKFLNELNENIKEDIFSLNVIFINNQYLYSGYPSGNYLSLFCKIIEIWSKYEKFPIFYQSLSNLEVSIL